MNKSIIIAFFVGCIVGFGVGWWQSQPTGVDTIVNDSADELAVLPEESFSPSVESNALREVANGLIASGRLAGDPIIIEEVKLSEPGYVVIHEDDGGAPGAIIGVSDFLSAGTKKGVEIQLDRASVVGETLWAMLHGDNGDGEFEFPGADAPLQDELGEIIMIPIPIN